MTLASPLETVTTHAPVVLGTRGSGLALRQTEEVLDRLQRAHPDGSFRVVTLRTGGDQRPTAPLASMGRGVFVKELEEALLRGEIDVAVHSLKDLPTELPPELTIGAVLERGDPRDVLVNRWGCSLADLPPGARIGTSSPRRAALVRAERSDVRVLPIRGNVDTRLRKAQGGECDGVVLAAAGLARLGLTEKVSQFLDPQRFVPAPGQGALVVEVRRDDGETLTLVRGLDDEPTHAAVEAERAFLRALGGGCQVPVGAYAQVVGERLEVYGLVASEDGSILYRASVWGEVSAPEVAGRVLYEELVSKGAGRVLGMKE